MIVKQNINLQSFLNSDEKLVNVIHKSEFHLFPLYRLSNGLGQENFLFMCVNKYYCSSHFTLHILLELANI